MFCHRAVSPVSEVIGISPGNLDSSLYFIQPSILHTALYMKYKELADKEENTIFGGRLAEYRYYDMHHIVENVLNHPEFR